MSQAIDIGLRDVRDADLAVFFEQQLDPSANHMVAFTRREPTDREAFAAHWAKIRADQSVSLKTILFENEIAGYIGSFVNEGHREVGYWLGKEFWGKGVASASLSLYLDEYTGRPLYGFVAKDNLASLRVLEKCGFTIVEKKRAFAKARGQEIDELVTRLG